MNPNRSDIKNCPNCGRGLKLVACQNGYMYLCEAKGWGCSYFRPFEKPTDGAKLNGC